MQKKHNQSNFLPNIGIDLMGSDTDAFSVVASLLPVLDTLQHKARFTLFGKRECAENIPEHPCIFFEPASESVEPDDPPLWAARKKKNSSLTLGIESLKNGKIDAFISMGNTGALLTTARTRLKTLPSITHPALLALIPGKNKDTAILDVGANAEYKSSHLVEFAAMGIAYQKTRGVEKPSVGLLNIGKETVKGPPELRQAYRKLETLSNKSSDHFFIGNIEARDVFTSQADVLVTGGFSGNIFLKTAEGMARFILEKLPVAPSSQPLSQRLDYRKYPGAVLCGVRGIVIKCHGEAKIPALTESILSAIDLVKQDFLQKIQREIAFFFASEV